MMGIDTMYDDLIDAQVRRFRSLRDRTSRNRVACNHGYIVLKDSCPDCDAATDVPHRFDPDPGVGVCRNCGRPHD